MDIKLATKLVAIIAPVATGMPWLSVAAQFVDVIVTHLDSNEFEQNTRRALNDLRNEVRQVSTQVARQTYRHHMGAGRRILQDLPLHQIPERYQQAVENAKTEFQRASAVATDLGSSDLVITAELAITGCWYVLQSPEGVRATLDGALTVAEHNVLLGDRAVVNRYRQVLSLCRTFGVVTATSVIPIDPAKAPRLGAALTAHAPLGAWADLWSASLLVTAVGHGAANVQFYNQTTVAVTIRLRPLTGESRPGNRLMDMLNGARITDAYEVKPDANVLLELRLTGPSKARLAVTVELPVSWGRPGAQVGPSVAFLLPKPGQLPAAPPPQQQVQPRYYGQYLLPPGYRPYQ
ncbi:MAG TPA: hypothetical protein VJT49_07630 [Amycolatopsis sp.]|uniref:hypothetical protein n=1 Tax=Amycolatopsis sp. TaxID=37632 RepID=UPI002B468326|nr:hypothetical protein [Amycolatopsis sp.]HKS44977.1 hypothetical protein [Amycolatopsis sp.]